MKKFTPERLTIFDLKNNPVWQYCNRDSIGETIIRPVIKLPVTNLQGKLVGSEVELANGNFVWSLIGNIDINNDYFTKHFLTISIEKNGKWFTLSRYHDFDFETNGPKGLAEFLFLNVNEVFPLSYDIRKYCISDSVSLFGKIQKEPKEKLTRTEIIAMSVL